MPSNFLPDLMDDDDDIHLVTESDESGKLSQSLTFRCRCTWHVLLIFCIKIDLTR